jgi:hypothetical protein
MQECRKAGWEDNFLFSPFLLSFVPAFLILNSENTIPEDQKGSTREYARPQIVKITPGVHQPSPRALATALGQCSLSTAMPCRLSASNRGPR